MNRYILIVFIVLNLVNHSFGQKWTYSSGGNAFDGKYKTSFIVGTGEEFPYNEPTFVINYFESDENINVYINNAGYAGCDNKFVKIKFTGDEKIYTFEASTGQNEKIWFLKEALYFDNALTFAQLLKKIMKYKTMFIRIKSDCGKNDLTFSLSGSSNVV